MNIRTWSRKGALDRQDEIRDLLNLPGPVILERNKRLDFVLLADRLLAEEYAQLESLLK